MRLRATVEFADDVADAVEIWPDAYKDEDTAKRWGAIMERLYPGSVAMELEVECEAHGWKVKHACVDCGEPLCEVEAGWSENGWDDKVCEDCQELRSEDAENECGCGSYCSNCTGIPDGPL